MAVAIVCSTIVLPAFGGDTMSPRWPLPIGASRSMIRAVAERVPVFQAQPFVGIQRGQLVEVGAGRAGRHPVDRVRLV